MCKKLSSEAVEYTDEIKIEVHQVTCADCGNDLEVESAVVAGKLCLEVYPCEACLGG